MEYREFGKTGFKVSVIGMGTYYVPSYIFLARLLRLHGGRDLKIAALRKGIELVSILSILLKSTRPRGWLQRL